MKNIQDFENKIVIGDCIEVMKEIPTASIDLIVTDPPYLVNYTSRDGRSIANDKTDEWLVPAFSQMYRVLKPNSFMVCFYAWNKIDRFFAAWRSAGFYPAGHLVWTKNYCSSERFVGYSHESAYLLVKGRPEIPSIVLRDVLDWQYTGNKLHPTQKPIMAIQPVIKAFSQVGDIVLDPFIGSGTTAIAARSLGRKYIGIEIDPIYAHKAIDRIKGNSQRRLSFPQ